MMSLPVLAGSLSGEFAELADEIADVFKSAVQTDLQDTPGGFQEELLLLCRYGTG